MFLGFLPKKDGERLKILERYKEFDGAKIVYESPFRIKKLEEQIKIIYGDDVQIAITREMTKKFEEVLSTVEKELKGEMTVIFY
jgi:16S rRNA (cytidine1402-2'-O)-methyltransferase